MKRGLGLSILCDFFSEILVPCTFAYVESEELSDNNLLFSGTSLRVAFSCFWLIFKMMLLFDV